GLADNGVALRQWWLAATALAVLEAPNEPAPLVVSPPLGWRPSYQAAASLIDVWTGTPWVQPVPLDAIDSEPEAGTLMPPDEQPAAQTSPTADAAAALMDSVAQYQTLLAEPVADDQFAAATVRAASAAWRVDPDAGREYATAALDEVRDLLSQVSLQVAPT